MACKKAKEENKKEKEEEVMGLTSAERYNRRMDKIFAEARELPSSLNYYYWRKGKIVKRKKAYNKKKKRR